MKTIAGIALAGLLLGATGFSADLDEWEVVVPSSTYLTLMDVTYGAGTFVVVGETHTPETGAIAEIFTSTDGARWTRRISGVRGTLIGTTYGANGFVSVGAAHASPGLAELILTSPDGISWTRRLAGLSNHLFDVSYGKNGFVAVGLRGAIAISPDGIIWSDRSLRPSDPALTLWGVAAEPSMVAVGVSVTSYQGVAANSPDGVQWTRRNVAGSSLRDVVYGNNHFIAVGENDTVLRSTNGVNWTASATGVNGHLLAALFQDGIFIAVGYPGSVMSSVDGARWQVHRRGTELLYGIAYGNGMYVAVDYDGAILRTPPPNSPPVAVAEVSLAAEFFSEPPNYVVISPNGLNATVALSGSGSSDPDDDALSFLWLEREAGGSTTEIARTEQTTVVLPLGRHDLTLRVGDAVAQDAHDFQVHVITASEALEYLLALVQESDLPRRDKHPLLILLGHAQRPFEEGDIKAGLHHL